MLSSLVKALLRENAGRPPLWFMRQAGRYHKHYQAIRAKHSFIDVCKTPQVAFETTMGPIEDFDFDAAILFSDILFPLEAMGMGLDYAPGPKLSFLLRAQSDLEKVRGGAELAEQLRYQADAVKLLRRGLPVEKDLIGFVGAPLTLFYFATEGSHKKDLTSARSGLTDGRYDSFCEKLEGLLAQTMIQQAKAGADVMAIFDTCGGDLEPGQYRDYAVPPLQRVLTLFRQQCPDVPVIYYSKKTTFDHWQHLTDLPFQGLGIDWHQDICEALVTFKDRWAVQGNVDPDWLFLEPAELTRRLQAYFTKMQNLAPEILSGWVCGLGHGVLPKTPEDNVHLFIKLQREMFA